MTSINNQPMGVGFGLMGEKSMKKKPELTDQTKKNLMDAFWQIYGRKRIEDITVKEVAERAGYNRGTFYQYFSDIYDVLEQIEVSVMPSIDTIPVPYIKDMPMSLAMGSILAAYEEKGKYLTVLLGEHGDPEFQFKVKSKIVDELRDEFRNRGFKDCFELDIGLEYAISAMIGVMNHYFSLEDRPPLEQLISHLAKITTEGIPNALEAIRLH